MIYWCSLGKFALNHFQIWNLPATLQMHTIIDLTWDLAFYAPSALRPGAWWSFSFAHPKSLYEIASIYFNIYSWFILSFQFWILMICRSSQHSCTHVLITKFNWANLTLYLQSLIQSLVRHWRTLHCRYGHASRNKLSSSGTPYDDKLHLSRPPFSRSTSPFFISLQQ